MMMNRIMCSSKIFTDLSFTNNKDKKVCKIDLQHFSSKNVLAKHKEAFLSINGLHLLKLEKGIIELSQTKIKIKIISNKYQFHLKFMMILSLI